MWEQRKSALVIDASPGIGATYADRLAKRGRDLILVACDKVRMERLADRPPTEARYIDAFPKWVMEVDALVDAVSIGIDRGETVTIPSLADERQSRAYEDARQAMGPNLSRRDVAERYRPASSG